MSGQFARQSTIEDVKRDDNRVQITGYVKEIVENEYFLLNDKTGEIKVNIKEIDFNYKIKDLINVFGDLVFSTNGEKSIEADIIQDMNNLNFNYYRKLYDLKKDQEK